MYNRDRRLKGECYASNIGPALGRRRVFAGNDDSWLSVSWTGGAKL